MGGLAVMLASAGGFERERYPRAGRIRKGVRPGLVADPAVSEDIDATFSRKVLFDEDIEVSYRDPDGRARLLYLDRNHNDTLGLLHERAYEDSQTVDVAVTKLARFADQDREDIRLPARKRLIDSGALRRRAEEALSGYVGDAAPVRDSIEAACRLVDAERRSGKRRK